MLQYLILEFQHALSILTQLMTVQTRREVHLLAGSSVLQAAYIAQRSHHQVCP